MRRYTIFLSLIIVACLIALQQWRRPPAIRKSVPEPVPALIVVDPEQTKWESVATGYGLQPAIQGHNYDPTKVDGGWRLFKADSGDYKITYSVDEWVLVATSEKGIVNEEYQPIVMASTARSPWWLYFNLVTCRYQYVYGQQQSNCPNGQCPLTESVDERNSADTNAEDRSGSSERIRMPSGHKRMVWGVRGRR